MYHDHILTNITNIITKASACFQPNSSLLGSQSRSNPSVFDIKRMILQFPKWNSKVLGFEVGHRGVNDKNNNIN
jgi:hypothetical protein